MLELFVLSLALIVNSIIILLVLIKNHKSLLNRVSALLVFALALWTLFSYLSVDYNPHTLFLMRLVMFSVVLENTSFYFLTKIFPDKLINKDRRFFIEITYSILVMLLTISPFLFSDIAFNNDGSFSPVVAPGMIFFLGHVAWFVVGGIVALVRRYSRSNKAQKAQLRSLLLGALILYGLTPATNFLLPIVFKNSWLISLSPLYTALFAFIIGYSIITQKLFDIKLLIVRSLTYFFLLAFLASVYLVSIFTLGGLIFGNFDGMEAYWASTIIALLVGFSFCPLKSWFTRWTDKIFFRDRYDFEELTSSLNETATSTIVLPELLFKFLNLLIDEMRITKGAFVLLEGKKIFEIQSVGYKKSFILESGEIDHLSREKKIEVSERAKEGSTCKRILRNHDASVIVPLIVENELIGLLFLGDKKSGDTFTDRDIEVIKIVSKQLSLGIQNAKAYEKTQKFNLILRAEVNRATKELRGANEKLQELDQAKDEFISLASHEIRTPIATLEGYLSILNNPKLQDKDRKDIMARAYEGVGRLATMAKDLLDVSRIEQKRLKINKDMTRLERIVDRAVEGFELQARDKKIYVKYKKPKKALPEVYIDPDRITEVFNNIIGNAIKFTHKGGITITTDKLGSNIRIIIADTGEGIPKDSMKHIFEKFYQAQTASSILGKDKGGTGLGLYITKHIIEAHGGKIWLESRLKKGTTFFIDLPINKK